MKSARNVKKALLALCLSLVGLVNASASPLYCTGKIFRVFSNNSGDVYFYTTWRSDYIFACNMVSTVNNINPSVCKGWYASAVAAAQTQTSTIMFFPDTNVPSCDVMPTYTNASPVGYFMYMVN